MHSIRCTSSFLWLHNIETAKKALKKVNTKKLFSCCSGKRQGINVIRKKDIKKKVRGTNGTKMREKVKVNEASSGSKTTETNIRSTTSRYDLFQGG